MPSDQLKPKSPEKTKVEKICDTMRELAAKLPTPSGAGREDEEGQFGNNFYLLFLSMSKNQENLNQDFLAAILKRVEDLYPEKWKKFLEGNTALLNKIQEVLREQRLLTEIFDSFTLILSQERNPSLAKQIAEEINLDGLGNDVWNKLNPLLRQAAEAMKQAGINPEDFYS